MPNRSIASQNNAFMLIIQWILANLIGGLIIGAFSGPNSFLMQLVLRGLIIALVQWPVIRSVRPQARRWIWITSVGMILSNLLTLLPVSPVNQWLSQLATTLTQESGLWEVFWLNLLNEGQTWFLVGVAQAFFLRRQAPFWILAGLLGGLTLGAASATLCYNYCGSLDGSVGVALSNALVAGGAWATYGVMTGWALKRKSRG